MKGVRRTMHFPSSETYFDDHGKVEREKRCGQDWEEYFWDSFPTPSPSVVPTWMWGSVLVMIKCFTVSSSMDRPSFWMRGCCSTHGTGNPVLARHDVQPMWMTVREEEVRRGQWARVCKNTFLITLRTYHLQWTHTQRKHARPGPGSDPKVIGISRAVAAPPASAAWGSVNSWTH